MIQPPLWLAHDACGPDLLVLKAEILADLATGTLFGPNHEVVVGLSQHCLGPPAGCPF